MRVWIDFDISFGEFANEVDDGYALIHALMVEKYLKTFTIVGISSVHGNTFNMKFQRECTEKILSIMGRSDIPFFDGAGSAKELGDITPAVKAIVRALEDGPLTILGMGRLTNIATVIKLRADLFHNINELVIMGGRQLEVPIIFGKKHIEFPDLNIDGDLEAMEIICKNRIPLAIIPTECMTETLITKDHLKRMSEGSEITRLMAKVGKPWLLIWRALLGSPNGFIPWDVFMITYLTNPELFQIERAIPCSLIELPNRTHHLYSFKKRSKRKKFLCVSRKLDSDYLVNYCHNLSTDMTDRLVEFWLAYRDRDLEEAVDK